MIKTKSAVGQFSPVSFITFCFAAYITALVFFTSQVQAQTTRISRTIKELNAGEEYFPYLRVRTARLVYVNYGLLAEDFPALKRSPNETISGWKKRLDDWLLERVSYIRATQLLYYDVISDPTSPLAFPPIGGETPLQWHNRWMKYVEKNGADFHKKLSAVGLAVNTPIDIDWKQTRDHFVPTNYGRGHVIATDGGLLDMKGTGGSTPSHKSHRNGLLALSEAIREVIMQKTVDAILKHAKLNYRTVGTYAAVDFGFRIVHQDGTTEAAGSVVRQAIARSNFDENSNVATNMQIEVETALRRYGLTTTGDSLTNLLKLQAEGKDVSRLAPIMNLQGSDKGDIIDFGHITTYQQNDFKNHITVSNEMVKNPDLIETEIERLRKIVTTPDPQLQVPEFMFGQTQKLTDPIHDRVSVYSRDLAESLQKDFNRDHVETHLKNFLKPLAAQLRSAGWNPAAKFCRSILSK